MYKRVGVLMYQTSASKGQELVAQRMVQDFNSFGQTAFLITSIYHDGAEVIPAESLSKNKGYIFTEDAELGIPVIRVDSYIVTWPRRRIFFKNFVNVLERIVEEYKLNVLVTHSTLWNGPEEVAKFVSWRRYMREIGGYRDPLVYCHMSHFQEPSPKRYSLVERTFRMAWNRLALSQILKTANLVLVVTPFEKTAKVKMGADSRKCLLFPSGVDDELFLQFATADASQFRKDHGIPEDATVISYVGTLEERKNPIGVLKVAELLKERPDVHFVIAGRGDQTYAEHVKAEAKQLPNVTYVGEITDKEKILLIKTSRINILLSQLEALGLTQIEFMYQGVPVVTSGVGGQAWLVQDGKEGIHTKGPEDFEGAAAAIRTLVDNPETYNKLSANAKAKGRSLTCSKSMERLDEAISAELLKDNGLFSLPAEARGTLVEAEKVVRAWSEGSWSAAATDKRLFIRHGRLSRKVIEVPYENIQYVEHSRRYAWKALVAGLLPALTILLEPLWHVALNSNFLLAVKNLFSTLTLNSQTVLAVVALAPIGLGMALFAILSRTCFNLHTRDANPIFLPHSLKDVVTFVRQVQDGQEQDKLSPNGPRHLSFEAKE